MGQVKSSNTIFLPAPALYSVIKFHNAHISAFLRDFPVSKSPLPASTYRMLARGILVPVLPRSSSVMLASLKQLHEAADRPTEFSAMRTVGGSTSW